MKNRYVCVSTSLATHNLSIYISRENKEPKRYDPGAKSAQRLHQILKNFKPVQVFIDSFGPSVHYHIPKAVYPPPPRQAKSPMGTQTAGQQAPFVPSEA